MCVFWVLFPFRFAAVFPSRLSPICVKLFLPYRHSLFQLVDAPLCRLNTFFAMLRDSHDINRRLEDWNISYSVPHRSTFNSKFVYRFLCNPVHLLLGHWFVAFIRKLCHLLAFEIISCDPLEYWNSAARRKGYTRYHLFDIWHLLAKNVYLYILTLHYYL